MSEWSIEREIASCFGERNVATALEAWGLITAADDFQLETLADWYRSGSETYSYVFTVVSAKMRATLRCKACVGSGLGSVGEVFTEWLRRRELIISAGVSTPHLYCARAAALIEEEIPYQLRTLIEGANETSRTLLVGRLGQTIGKIARLGFPLTSLHDLRSRGDDVVWVDFGEDLGPPGMVNPDNSSALQMALEYVEVLGLANAGELAVLSLGYEEGLTQGQDQ